MTRKRKKAEAYREGKVMSSIDPRTLYRNDKDRCAAGEGVRSQNQDPWPVLEDRIDLLPRAESRRERGGTLLECPISATGRESLLSKKTGAASRGC
jgi:hypothetical protein